MLASLLSRHLWLALLVSVVLITADPGAAGAERLPGPRANTLLQIYGGTRLVSERFYVPVVRFPALRDGITLDALRAAWRGDKTAASGFETIYVDPANEPDLSALLGSPGLSVRRLPAAEIADAVWSDPLGLGIVPFEALTPRLRPLRLDGLSVTDNRLVPGAWPLAKRVWEPAGTASWQEALASWPAGRPATNRDPGRLTVLAMTGVTAIARGTAAAIDRTQDPGWPARIVGPELAAADITTISNEIPFVEDCVTRNVENNLTLCSKPSYFANLELSGADLVGLTGNHLNDFGQENLLYTLDLYHAKGIRVYAGGRNDEAAQSPLLVEHHGNRLAFLGANAFGPPSDLAGPDYPGSALFDLKAMTTTLSTLHDRADLVFAELQFQETDENGDYTVEPIPTQLETFQALSDAGADVVTGVQAHAPQALELRGRGAILYGLGNLYFDQTWSWPTRTGLIARYTIYDHRLISIELLVTVIKDDMQLRWATPQERAQVLESIFKASGW